MFMVGVKKRSVCESNSDGQRGRVRRGRLNHAHASLSVSLSVYQLIQFLFSQMQPNSPSSVGLKRKL